MAKLAQQHGGQVYQFVREQQPLIESLNQVLDFSASINPIQPTIDWSQLTQQAQTRVPHYPDSQQLRLKQALAQRFQLQPSQITLTNGISSAIINLFSELKPDTSALFTPIYSEYRRAAQCYSQQVIEIKQQQPLLTPQHLSQLDCLTEHSLLVLVNPSTPLGLVLTPEQIAPLLTLAEQKNCWLLLDESFLPFIGLQAKHSIRSQLLKHPKTVVLQSLTKFYACPGIRIGALFSAPHTLQHIPWPSWPISVLDELFILQALADPEHEQKTQEFLQTEQPRFMQALQQSELIERVMPSQLNFVLVYSRIPAQQLLEQLTAFNILVRDCQNFGLGEYSCRIAVRSTEDNDKLIQALQKIATQLNMDEANSVNAGEG